MSPYALAAALAVGMMPSSLQAAPVTPASSTALASAHHERADVIAVAARRCWWRNGQRHCRSIDTRAASRARGYPSGVGDQDGQDASKVPIGSRRWWEIKEREGSAGNRP